MSKLLVTLKQAPTTPHLKLPDVKFTSLVVSPREFTSVSTTGFVLPPEMARNVDGFVYHYPKLPQGTTFRELLFIPFLYDYNERVQMSPSLLHDNVEKFNWVIHAIKYLIYPQVRFVDAIYAKHTTQHNLLTGLDNHFKGIATLDVSSLIFQALEYPSPPPMSYPGSSIRNDEFADWFYSALVNDVPITLFVKILSVMYGKRICK